MMRPSWTSTTAISVARAPCWGPMPVVSKSTTAIGESLIRRIVAAPVGVPVVDVRVMGVSVHQRGVVVRVAVRLAAVPGEVVRVLVVGVVAVRVVVVQGLVGVLVLVALAPVQPHAQRHQRGRRAE